MTTVSPARTNNFDSIRLVLAVLVILSHAFPLGRGSNATEPLFALTHGQTTIGELSVWGFFVISGFLITQSWIRSPSPISYLKRRAGRIYPGFIVLSLLSALVIVPIASSARIYPQLSVANIANVLRLQEFQTPPVFSKNVTHAMNGSLWSIPYEFWCYLGVLFLGMSRLLHRRCFVIVVFFLVIALHVFMEISGWNPGGKIFAQIFGYPRFWPIVLPFFLAGMLFQLFGGRTLIRSSLIPVALIILVASYFIPHGVAIAMPICGSYLLLALAYLAALHPLNLGRYGDFSYGVYLYAFPIEQLVVMAAGGHMSPLVLFALATPITLLIGSLSWFLVERHFLSKSSQLKHEGKDLPADLRNQARSPLNG